MCGWTCSTRVSRTLVDRLEDVNFGVIFLGIITESSGTHHLKIRPRPWPGMPIVGDVSFSGHEMHLTTPRLWCSCMRRCWPRGDRCRGSHGSCASPPHGHRFRRALRILIGYEAGTQIVPVDIVRVYAHLGRAPLDYQAESLVAWLSQWYLGPWQLSGRGGGLSATDET